MSKKIVVDEDLCIACGTCSSVCPDYFEVHNGEKSKVIKPYSEADATEIEDAKESCPVGAIEIIEE